jgi:hypothetical protein
MRRQPQRGQESQPQGGFAGEWAFALHILAIKPRDLRKTSGRLGTSLAANLVH